MSPRQAATKAPPRYISGHCGIGRCDACWGVYAGAACTHGCHQLEAVPEPAPAPEPERCGTCGQTLPAVTNA